MDQLTRKVGPLPLWAYGAIGGGAALAFKVIRGGGGKATAAAIPYTGTLAGSDGGGGGSSGGSTGEATPAAAAPSTFTSNPETPLPTYTDTSPVRPTQQPGATPVAVVGGGTDQRPIVPPIAETTITGNRSGFPAKADVRDFLIDGHGIPMSVSPIGGLPTQMPAVVGSPAANTQSTPAALTTGAAIVNVAQSDLARENQPPGGVQSSYIDSNTQAGRDMLDQQGAADRA